MAPVKTARERVLEVAEDLFYREGVRAVGIDTIITRSGVAKMSLYRNFASKDELIVAMLEHHVDRSVQHYRDMLAAHPAPADFLAALRTAERSPRDPLGRAPLLHLELILYVARLERRRPDLRERLRTRRALTKPSFAPNTGTRRGVTGSSVSAASRLM